MRVRAPIGVRPAMTTCGAMRVPASIRTSLPMIEYAATSTSAAISGLDSICAVEWSRDMGLGPVHAMGTNANGWHGAPIAAADEAKTRGLGEESNKEWRPRAP